MDVFLVNGNSCSMAARPLTAPSKPAVFQEPRKQALKPMNHKKSMKKVQKNPKKVKPVKKEKLPRSGADFNRDSSHLKVKLPSFEEKSSSSMSSSTSSEDASDDDEEYNEEDDELYPEVTRSSRAESAISNQHFEVHQENICAARVSRASNSPWYESQRGYSVPLDSELPTELPIVDLPPEVELEHEVLDDEVDVDDHVDNDIVQVVENLKQPVNSKKSEEDIPMRLKISRTPETLVQLMEDVESEEEMTENKDEEILEEELDGECLAQTPTNDDDENAEDIDDNEEEKDVLTQAIEGNEKRMEKIRESDMFYENQQTNNTNNNDNDIEHNIEARDETNSNIEIREDDNKSAHRNCESARSKNFQAHPERSQSSSSSTATVTLPSSCSFTSENDNEEARGYNDILNVLERLESETKNEEDESNSKGSEAGDNDSGRPQSEQNGSLSDFSSPKRTTSSTGGGPPPPTLRPSSSSEARKSSEGFTTTTTTNKRTNNQSVQKGGGGAGGSKVNDLMSYLDSVGNEKLIIEAGENDPDILRRTPINSKIAELAGESSKKLAEQVVNLQYVVEEKERAIEVLRQALEHQRKLSANFSQKFQKELNQRLASQKSEYEATIHRHQNFIDQLIEDKKVLAERCDGLNADLTNNERKFQDSLKNLDQRHTAEIRRLKSIQETSNKIKQEKWLDEKTRRIKEQTVRGLEPEIQRLLARHNAELADMDAERERRLSAQERELHQKHLQHIRELRANWEEENAEGWIHERQLLTTRHNQQLEELNGQHQEEIERLQEQLRRERARGHDDRLHYENEANQVRRIAQERAAAEIDRIRDEEETKRKVLAKKHASEMTSLKESEATERIEWERKCRQRLDEEWKQQEDGLRERFRKERDAELDRVVSKLEAEVISGRRDVEVEFTERISRLKGKYEAEMTDLGKELDMVREKWTKSREEAAKTEEEMIMAKALLKQKEAELNQAMETNAKFEAEREDVRQAVRGEFSVAIDGLTTERSDLLNQMSDLRLKLAEAQSERDAAEKEWQVKAEDEAVKIHAKVKAAIQKKEEKINELQSNYDRAMAECQHLETLLQRQTKQNYLSNTSKPRPGRK